MGRYKPQTITNMQDPYKDLVLSGSLAENAETLNNLEPAKQREVASKIIINCPQNQINQLGLKKEALNNHGKSKNTQSFYHVLSQAHTASLMLYSIIDAKNPKPFQPLTDKFNADLFNQFPNLTNELIKGHQTQIAIRLAISTPPNKISAVLQNINILAPESPLSRAVGAALELNYSIKSTLLKNNPEKFFLSKYFNLDLCHQFSNLFHHHLKGKEQSIAQKLASSPVEKHGKIGRILDQLNEKATDTNNPFRLIAQAFNLHAEKISQSKHSTNGPGFFAPSQKTEQLSNQPSQTQELEVEKESQQSNLTICPCNIL